MATEYPRSSIIRAMTLCAITVLGAALPPAQDALAQATVAGFTPGSFSVSPSGAATYTIPIQVPPGIAGVDPKLALAYNSQSGNGPLGMGWGLSGLSSIQRCPQTFAQDGVRGGINYDANDRFCVDGQRLIPVSATVTDPSCSGTEYRTELESFTRVIACGSAGNGPASFKAWAKSGQITEYGNDASTSYTSRVEAVPVPNTTPAWLGTVRVWALSKLSDRKGNYLTVTYTKDSGDYYPSRIDYTGNTASATAPSASVVFVNDPVNRTDPATAYVAGSIITTLKRLQYVRTYAGANPVREYRLAYDNNGTVGRSRLTSVTECDNSGACLGPVTFAFLPNNSGSIQPSNFWLTDSDVPAGTGTSNPSQCHAHLGDFNGDSRTDYMWNYNGWWVALANPTGTGFATPRRWLLPIDPVSGISTSNGSCNYEFVGDFNGDGKTDYMWESGGWYVALANAAGDGFDQPLKWLDATAGYGGRPTRNSGSYAFVGDFNGDGKTDYMWNYEGWQVALSTGTSFTPPTGFWLQGNAGVGGRPTTNPGSYNFVGDFNGDGKADFLWNYEGWQVALSTGTSFTPPTAFWLGPYVGVGGRPTQNPGNAYTYVGDFNGDGKTDLMWNYEGWQVALGAGPFPDLATSITSSLGTTTTSTYLPLTNSTIYTRDADTPSSLCPNPNPPSSTPGSANLNCYPYQNIQNATYVVSSANSSNGIGGILTANYTYAGLKADLTGRGLLGFRTLDVTNPDNTSAHAEFRQDWPFTGMPSLSQKKVPSGGGSGGVVSSSSSSLGCTNPVTGSACTIVTGNRYFPYVSQNTSSGYDLNGAVFPTVTTTTVYDAWGNPTSVVASTGDGYSKTTTNTYTTPDTANWFLGRLIRSTVTSVTP